MKKTVLCIIITALMFALLEPVSKLVSASIDPTVITFTRFLIGGVFLLPFSLLAIKKNKIRLTAKAHLLMAGMGILLICVSMQLLQFSVKLSQSPATVAIIFSCNSVTTIIISAVFQKYKITLQKILALILCITGIIICAFESLLGSAGKVSMILAILSAITFSIYSVLNKQLAQRIRTEVSLSYSFIYGSTVLLIYLLIQGVNPIEGLNTSNVLYILILGIGVTGIGYLAYLTAIKTSSAVNASFAFFIKPIIAPFLAYIIVGQPFSKLVFIGLVPVMVGLYLANYYKVC